jgi:hypothetical protein
MQHENIKQEKKPGENSATANDINLQQEKALAKNDSDTEPDEFIAPNADTDQPLDGKGIVNDAVLGGEDHGSDNFQKRSDKKRK